MYKAMVVSVLCFSAALVVAAAAVSAANAPRFISKAWKTTGNPTRGSWSREAMARQFCEQFKVGGKDRSEIMALLGEPTISQEYSPCDSEAKRRLDEYQLSSENRQHLLIQYNHTDHVYAEPLIDIGGCKWTHFAGAAQANEKILTDETLRKFLLDGERSTYEQTIKALGKPSLSWDSTSKAGARVFHWHQTEWKMSADGRKMFYVQWESQPERGPYGITSNPQSNYQVYSYSLVTLAPTCPIGKGE